MRTTERLTKLRDWIQKELCEGRLMKTPAENMDITKIVRQEPRVYLAFAPMRADKTGFREPDPINTVPSITIMPSAGYVKYMEEQRFDRYKGVHRPQELGQQLAVNVLFAVYEDGVRLPGFIDKAEAGEGLDMSLMLEGTEEGLFALMNWMDDFKEKLLGQKSIPGTDLFVNEASMIYGMRSDQRYIADKRPIYYGQVDVIFQCYAEEKTNTAVQTLLE